MLHIYESANGFFQGYPEKSESHELIITQGVKYHGLGAEAQVPGYHAAHVFEVSSSAVVHSLALLKPLLIVEVEERYELLKKELFEEFQMAHFEGVSETDLDIIRTKVDGLGFNMDEKIVEIENVGTVYDALALDHVSFDYVVVIPAEEVVEEEMPPEMEMTEEEMP